MSVRNKPEAKKQRSIMRTIRHAKNRNDPRLRSQCIPVSKAVIANHAYCRDHGLPHHEIIAALGDGDA